MSENRPLQLAFLTFRLAEQYYALPIHNIVEVAAMMTVSSIPNASEAIMGMINRHGEAVPMLDLRLTFRLPVLPVTESTLFIVAQVDEKLVGLVVDEIEQVRYVEPSSVKVVHGAGKYIENVISTAQRLYQEVRLGSLYQDYLTNIQS